MTRQQTLPSQDQSLPVSAFTSSTRSQRRLFWEAGVLGGVLLLALLLRLWHLNTLTDNYDEGVYLSSLRSMYAGNGLFTPVFSSQPPFFLLSLYPLVALLGPTQFAARLEIVCLSLISILAIYLLARRSGGPWVGASAAVLLAFDSLYLKQSQTIDAEIPSIALMLVAAAFATYANRYPWQAALLSGAATALAILEKLFAVTVFAPIAVLFLSQLITFERGLPLTAAADPARGVFSRLHLPHRQTISRAILLVGAYLIGLALAGLLVFLPYLGQLHTVYQQVIAFHLAASQSFASTMQGNIHLLLDAAPERPLAILAVLGLIVGLIRRRWHVLTAAAWILAALVILLRQAPLFPHHLVFLTPGLALSAAIGLTPTPRTLSAETAALRARLQRIRPGWEMRASQALLIGLPALLLAGFLSLNVLDVVRYPLGPAANAAQISQIASDLERLTTPQQQVIVDDQYIATLANRDVPPALVDTSSVRIVTGYLTTEQVIAIAEQPQVGAILFYTGRFDALPGLRSWVEQHFHLARSYGKGQDLYVRASP
jgi:predicted membrane-bound mannosyltransferase